ncbi:TIGR02234 family membrane protein [Klenkia sp. PcliD-1-E]|uniref:TIGR02234 family membrane protein n=1 Tax=Klenkia sp. PcliD-1-E TaxID=2954492 RepID=UPI002096DE75|nr:TIGR02234 family membrane protein [Klenkia sp. PcliD-1-E]MCO7218726.1 TIGR02234 family membrane protein [Klenkia sp. PcliD-1-E]
MNRRRELTAAVLACAAAGGLALSSAGQSWAAVTVTRPAPLPPVDAALTGSTLAPLVPAAGLLLLAAAVALFAVRSWGRVVLGVLVVAAGIALGTAAVRTLTGAVTVDPADLRTQVGLDRATVAVDPSVGWPVLALLAGVLGVAAGLLVVLRGRGWPGMGQRYQRTGTTTGPAPRRPQTDEDRHQAAWKALDGGTDPTDDDPGR